MNKFKNVFVTGSIAYDTIMNFPNEFQSYFHAEKLHQINVSFVVDKLEKQLGGTGTNIAYNVSLIFNLKFKIFNQFLISNDKFLNEKTKVKLLGSVGKDGNDFLNFFKKNNIEASGVVVDKKLYTSAGSVITDTKNNQIWGFYYGASEKIPYVDFKNINKESDLLVISANHKNSFLYFQEEAIKNKISYLYDPGMTLTWISDKDLETGVMNCRYLVGNDYEIAMILKRLKKTVKELTSYGLRIITTLGEEGVRYEENVGNKNFCSVHVKGYHVKKMVDPTGAGDAWRGGFVAGLLMDYQIKDCLKLGNVMASFAIEKYGTVNHRPTRKEIEKRLKDL
ncbi:MAG: PfkB family carbohydrate kinase [Patescibacteria group bacterium]|jgi:adenosine kinase